MPEKKENIIPITVRMPESIKKAIYDLALKDRRSINAEIVFLLESALDETGVGPHKKTTGKK